MNRVDEFSDWKRLADWVEAPRLFFPESERLTRRETVPYPEKLRNNGLCAQSWLAVPAR